MRLEDAFFGFFDTLDVRELAGWSPPCVSSGMAHHCSENTGHVNKFLNSEARNFRVGRVSLIFWPFLTVNPSWIAGDDIPHQVRHVAALLDGLFDGVTRARLSRRQRRIAVGLKLQNQFLAGVKDSYF